MPRLAARAQVSLAALALPALALVGACADDPASSSSYLRIELLPVGDNSLGEVSAARVVIRDAAGAERTSFCVNLDGPPGEVVGSFVLERAASKPVSERATVEVTAFTLPATETTAVGKDYSCAAPGTPLGKAVLHVDFCAGQAKVLRFNVGALCPMGCAADQACGAGIGVDGGDCAVDACCSSQAPTACGLENAN